MSNYFSWVLGFFDVLEVFVLSAEIRGLEDLDFVLEFCAFEEAVYVETGEVNMLGFYLTNFDDFFGFNNYGMCCFCASVSTTRPLSDEIRMTYLP